MENYSTYKFYDGKLRRLSIFARSNGTQLEVFVLTCSKQDEFSKKLAREVYENYLNTGETTFDKMEYHPDIYILPINDNKPKWSLIMHCREKYWRISKKFQFFERSPMWVIGEDVESELDLMDIELKKALNDKSTNQGAAV